MKVWDSITTLIPTDSRMATSSFFCSSVGSATARCHLALSSFLLTRTLTVHCNLLQLTLFAAVSMLVCISSMHPGLVSLLSRMLLL